ncbi:hypothetical protein C3432_16515 [Citrobacter amalonaticus]|uniref:Uncharacterized protein n=1 Tax=Citrobacter amalonaticus TaxID=35703 RepID=A0A2S4RUE9_CITAM|nr:hypothetical protein C3432_16515 [Citrobacter amalonaticus]POT72735.1 hypothetical protein C3436_21370 [Citrobacter amalonaticus]POU63590.1 hypothetical protein C3430_19625 [Citrobacter amalonaticus]POV03354.1 hypothetical protein C3424_22540 [Citrobacter amalonaticus]
MAFWFYRINRYGQWEKYYYIQLRGASISSIQLRVIKNQIDKETISVNYDYLLSKHLISAMRKHINTAGTVRIKGKYRWEKDVYHYFNPSTNLDVMVDVDGNFISEEQESFFATKPELKLIVYTRHTSRCRCVGFVTRSIPGPRPFGASASAVQNDDAFCPAARII